MSHDKRDPFEVRAASEDTAVNGRRITLRKLRADLLSVADTLDRFHPNMDEALDMVRKVYAGLPPYVGPIKRAHMLARSRMLTLWESNPDPHKTQAAFAAWYAETNNLEITPQKVSRDLRLAKEERGSDIMLTILREEADRHESERANERAAGAL